jgi:ubiquinone/menaquinone biosynthesis C-methylase UbiE
MPPDQETHMSQTPFTAASPLRAAWERVGAAAYDHVLARGEQHGMTVRRRSLLSRAHGRVLEIGAGTGLNVGHYPTTVDEVVLSEPAPAMAARLRDRARGHDRARVVEAPAECLPLETGSVDTVVSTMVLCTVDDPSAALAEIARVLRPGGRLLFIEHVHAERSTRLRRWQDRLAGAWAVVALGCRCDRDLLASIGDRLILQTVSRERWKGMPPLVHPLVVGSAVKNP